MTFVPINNQSLKQGSRGQASTSKSTAVASFSEANWWTEEEARLYERWAGVSEQYKTSQINPYFDYFFCGQDMKIKIDGLDDNDFLPIYSFGYAIQQEKMPIYGFASYCVDEQTEALTQRGWVSGEALLEDDIILSLDPDDEVLKWSNIRSIFRNYNYDGMMHHLTNKNIDALVTPGHKFLTQDGLVPVENLRKQDKIIFMGNTLRSEKSVYTDAFVELVGWFVTEGHIGDNRIVIHQSHAVNPDYVESIRLVLDETGSSYTEKIFPSRDRMTAFSLRSNCTVRPLLVSVAPNRVLSYDFINSLSTHQIGLLIDTMIAGDGWRNGINGRGYIQKNKEHIDSFVALCAMGGIATTVVYRPGDDCYCVTLKVRKQMEGYSVNFNGGYRDRRYNHMLYEENHRKHEPLTPYKGLVWCPETEYGTFVCRRNNRVYVTGNTYDAMLRGTRIISGAFSLVVTEPFLLTNKIADSARIRAKTSQRNSSEAFALRHLDGDLANIERYWRRNYDSALDGNDRHLFSIHPPFNFLIKYGIQDVGLYSAIPGAGGRANEVRQDFKSNGPMWTDTNERLYDTESNSGVPNGGKILLENIELTGKTIEYDPSGDPILETYSFLARDERIVDKPYTMNAQVALPQNVGTNSTQTGNVPIRPVQGYI